MYGCEKWTIKKAECRRIDAFWTVVLERTLESPLDCKEIQSVHPKGDQSRVFIGRTDAEAETAILWSPDVKSWLICKDPDAGKDWGQEEKGMTEDEMVGWHHQHNGHGFGWTPGVGDGQGGLVCCGSWGRKESDTTERLNWTESSGSFFPPLSSCFDPVIDLPQNHALCVYSSTQVDFSANTSLGERGWCDFLCLISLVNSLFLLLTPLPVRIMNNVSSTVKMKMWRLI